MYRGGQFQGVQPGLQLQGLSNPDPNFPLGQKILETRQQLSMPWYVHRCEPLLSETIYMKGQVPLHVKTRGCSPTSLQPSAILGPSSALPGFITCLQPHLSSHLFPDVINN